MISHALTIVINELRDHFGSAYSVPNPSSVVGLGNLSEGVASNGTGGVARDMLILSIVNIKEEKTLKNLPNYVRNDAALTATYENPPLFLNFTVLMVATHTVYADALLVLSRALRFFQSQHVFTQDSVAPSSITTSAPTNALDQLEEFKLIFDLYSPSMEEVNHMWGTLGGKQYPFAMYNLRMLELKFRAVQWESGLVTEVVNDFHHRNGGGI
jgi:hypothetical protein